MVVGNKLLFSETTPCWLFIIGVISPALTPPPVEEQPVASTTVYTENYRQQRRSSNVVQEEAGTTVIKHLSAAPRTGHFFYVLIQLH